MRNGKRKTYIRYSCTKNNRIQEEYKKNNSYNQWSSTWISISKNSIKINLEEKDFAPLFVLVKAKTRRRRRRILSLLIRSGSCRLLNNSSLLRALRKGINASYTTSILHKSITPPRKWKFSAKKACSTRFHLILSHRFRKVRKSEWTSPRRFPSNIENLEGFRKEAGSRDLGLLPWETRLGRDRFLVASSYCFPSRLSEGR